jgi:Sensors of blue-light using FAD
MALHEIIYVSLASHKMAQTDLLALLDQSKVHNEARGITGLLMYHRHEFLQLLEGERDEVEALFATICRDRRHQQVYSMWEGPVQARSFDRWAMGFVSPDEAALRERPGYESVLSDGLISAGRGSNGKKILLQLRDDFLRPG